MLYEAASNVFDAGTSIDLNVLKVAFNGTELTVPSKIVSKDNNDANVFYEMQVDINIAGTANSTLKFFAAGTDNTKGLRLYNIRLLGVEKGGTDPEPSTNLLVNPSFETWTETNPDNWGRTSVTNVTYEKSAIAKTGTNAVLLKGNGKNARFGSSDITLAAGTYTLSVFSKGYLLQKLNLEWVMFRLKMTVHLIVVVISIWIQQINLLMTGNSILMNLL